MSTRKSKKVKNKPKRQAIIPPSKKMVSSKFHYQLSNVQLLLIALGVAVLAMLLYAPSFHYGFVYDDDAVVKNNRFVHQGFQGLDEIWTTTYFKGHNENVNARAYRPIPLTTLAIEYQFFALNPKVNHATNILFYGLTGFFLVLLLTALLRKYHFSLPIIIALLFIVHPIHIEVVANIKSRDELLAFLNYLIAFWLLLQYLDTKKILLFIASIAFYCLALFSKESAITTLAVIPAGLYFFRTLSWKKIALYTAPFVAAFVFYLIIRSSIVGGLNAGVTLTKLDNSLLAANGFAERSASNILVLGYYWFKTLFPHPLLSDYSYITIPLVNWDDWRVYVSLLTYIGLTGLMIWGFPKKRPYSFAIFYYFATVSLFTSIVVTNVSAYNDRFQYNASLGVCFLIGWGIYLLMKTQNIEDKQSQDNNRQKLAATSASLEKKWIKDWRFFLKKNVLPLSIVATLMALAIFKTMDHLPVWKDRYALFEHDIQYSPNNARMHKNYGGSLARKALAEQDKEQQKVFANQAIEELEWALSIYNRIPTGHVHLGNMYFLLKDFNKAEKAYRDALAIDSHNHHAKANLANIIYRKGMYRESVDMLESLNKSRFTKNDYYLLALGYEKLGNNQKAIAYRKLSGR